MDRETKTITTPVGKQVIEIKTYLIGREKRALQNVFVSSKMNVSAESQSVSGFDVATINQAQNLAWNTVIVSIDGKKDGVDGFSVVEAILDMRSEDYDFVVNSINELTAEKKS